MKNYRTYSELISLPTFDDRYRYLKLDSRIGEITFGSSRWLNQKFYTSKEWRKVRDTILVRDNGCDLADPDHEMLGGLTVHHINPITERDIVDNARSLFDPDNLITVSSSTHKAIHYGDESLLMFRRIIERSPNDTCPWKGGIL